MNNTKNCIENIAMKYACGKQPGRRRKVKRKVWIGGCVFVMALCMGACGFGDFESHSIVLDTEYQGDTIDICSSAVRNYLNLTDEKEIAAYLVDNNKSAQDYMMTKFAWEGDGSTSYTVHFSENEDFVDEVTYETEDTAIYNQGVFVPGRTYYWKVTGDAQGSDSKVDTFTVLDAPVRYITMEEGFNIRDLGGWKTEDGRMVKYGQIYRGGRVNNRGGNTVLSDEDLRVFRDLLGIRGEIDLRIAGHDDGNQTMSVFGSDVNYRKAPMQGYNYIFPNFKQESPIPRECQSEFVTSVGEVFHFLADQKNYPVYFHCNAGADRTGTVAFLINGLLGVSEEDLTKDFELTSFSQGGRRWRSDIVNGEFTANGIMQDDNDNYVAWGHMIEQLMNQYETESGTLSDAIANYLQTACHVTESEIEMIKEMMLENENEK